MSPRKKNGRATRAKKPAAATTTKVSPVVSQLTGRRSSALRLGADARFDEVVALIEAARGRAYEAVNSEVVALYWPLGEYISKKIASAEWGDGVVEDLAADAPDGFLACAGSVEQTVSDASSHPAAASSRRDSPSSRSSIQ